MSEEIKIGHNLFGYDTLVRDGNLFTSLKGGNETELKIGMAVVLLGDAFPWFNPGEEVNIIGFAEPFKTGRSDHIIQVSNGKDTGWVKPSNIQRNIASPLTEISSTDALHRKIRKAVHIAMADFIDLVYLRMNVTERNSLPSKTGPYIDAIVSYALQRLPEFGEELAETIARVYKESPYGERFVKDPINTSSIVDAMVYLDKDGQLISIKNPEIVWSPSTPSYMFLKQYESHKILSGPLLGKTYSYSSEVLGDPIYKPGVVSSSSTRYYSSQFETMRDKQAQLAYEHRLINSSEEADKINNTTILFLAADPSDATRLRLGEEFREIKENIRKAQMRESFKLSLPQLSVRPSDISQAILDESPRIIHFSGHGTSSGELCFEDEIGKMQIVKADALAALFELVANEIECVILNACYSATQAQEITKHINYVIGMNGAIGDKAAISFAVGFYQALGAGRSIEDAYRFGCVQIRLQNIPEHLTPVLIKKGHL